MIWVKVSPKTPVWKHYRDFLPKNAEPNGHFKRSKDLLLSSKMRVFYVPAKQTTLYILGPYSIWLIGAFQTNFSKQREES